MGKSFSTFGKLFALFFHYHLFVFFLLRGETVLLKHNKHNNNNDDNEIVKECGEERSIILHNFA